MEPLGTLRPRDDWKREIQIVHSTNGLRMKNKFSNACTKSLPFGRMERLEWVMDGGMARTPTLFLIRNRRSSFR